MQDPTVRTVLLTVALFSSGAALLSRTVGAAPVVPQLHVPWWLAIAAFYVASVCVLHIESNEGSQFFTLEDLPLVAGMFLLGPIPLVTYRVVALVLLAVRRRSPLLKTAFNAALAVAETSAAVLVFRSFGATDPAHPTAWVAALAAMAVLACVGVAFMTVVVSWHGGQASVRDVLGVTVMTTFGNTNVALLATTLLFHFPVTLLLLGAVMGVLLLLYRSYTSLHQRHGTLKLLYDFTRTVSGATASDNVAHEMLDHAARLLRAAVAEIAVIGEDGTISRVRRDAAGDLLPTTGRLDADESIWTPLVDGGSSVLVPRDTTDPRLAAYREQLGLGDAMVVALRGEHGTVGAMVVGDRIGDVRSFDGEDLELFESLANHASVALQNERLVQRLRREASEREHEATHDALTGLPNRALFHRRAEEAQRSGPTRNRFALAIMDLDGFKEVNDTLGHHSGDALLIEIGQRLQAALPSRATIARLGGDEFALLLPNVADAGDAMAQTRELLQSLEAPVELDELRLSVAASVGVALWPDHGEDASTLLRRADAAMYAAKSSRQQVELYSAERDDSSPRRLALAGDLARSIEMSELVVYHQPKVRLPDGEIVGTEALVRWCHPDLGFLSPDEFIPIAEHTGLIAPLTTFVLADALRSCRRWRDAGHDIGVAVNVAVRSLLDTDLPATVAALCREHGVPLTALTLEITESGIMADPGRTVGVLQELAALGVQLAIDDFGTGYSSLSYLQRLPVDEVKIDKSFVFRLANHEGDAVIVRAIIDLARNLGLDVVAEGVEDRVSWDRLCEMGCHRAQGYFMSKPVPEARIDALLAERRAPAGLLAASA